MKVLSISIILIAFLHSISQGQILEDFTDKKTNVGEYIPEIPIKKGERKGTVYLNENWYPGKIYFRNSSQFVETKSLKYDVKNGTLDLIIDEQERSLPIERVDSFEWSNTENGEMEYFSSSNQYEINGTAIPDIYQVKVKGGYTLLVDYYWKLKHANYNVAIDVGDKNSYNIIAKDYYLHKEGNGFKIPRKKSEFIKKVKKDFPGIEKVMKEKKLGLKKEKDLISITEILNSNS